MKHIGIVDITTVGACICANTIVAKAAETLGHEHPEFTLHAFPFERYRQALDQKNWSRVAELILSSIEKLQRAGADFVIIPSNTPHYAFAKIAETSPLPLLNLVEITVKECQRLRYQKILVLGTKLTMQGGLYASPLAEKGMQAVIPSEEDQALIQHLIFDEIIPSKVNPTSVTYIATRVQQYDCDAVILGCTELPEVFNQENCGVPVLDTTRLLAYHALKYAINH